MRTDICQISNEPGGDLVVRPSRLFPQSKLLVKKTWYDKGYEPREDVVFYGRFLISEAKRQGLGKLELLSSDARWEKIINNKLYFGAHIQMIELL